MPILNWLDRDNDIKAAERVPYRLLEAVPELSYGDADTENMLIQGDNLDALKALLPYYSGQVKCIFIDPPYNTRSAFPQYDDNLEHTKWLSMMYPRLELLREFLSEDGSIWVSLDDNEGHYLKVIMDEIFGRKNFVTTVVWKSTDNSNNDAKQFSVDYNYIFVYSKREGWLTNKGIGSDVKRSHFKNPDNDPKGPWFDGNPLNSPKPRPNLTFNIISPQGHIIKPPKNGWRWSQVTINEKIASGEIRFTPDGKGIRRRTYLADMDGLPPSNLWDDLDSTGHNRQAKYELKKLFPNITPSELFGTPKPEKLIKWILLVASEEGDLVLDSFLGSGTTSAVAHKMRRRHIGVEVGAHAETDCLPRFKKVVDGEQGGVSHDVEWKGGGGFKFYRLGAAIFDAEGQITQGIKYAHLAAHIWFSETKSALGKGSKGPLLGVHNGTAYYLLYNGILGDKRPQAGNVLTSKILEALSKHSGPKVIYGESSRLGPLRLADENIIFKQTPYDVKAR